MAYLTSHWAFWDFYIGGKCESLLLGPPTLCMYEEKGALHCGVAWSLRDGHHLSSLWFRWLRAGEDRPGTTFYGCSVIG